MKFKTMRDIAGGVAGVMGGIIGGGIGFGAKKLLHRDSSMTKKVLMGVAVSVLTLGTGLPAFLITSPRGESRLDMMNARQNVAQNRYGGGLNLGV